MSTPTRHCFTHHGRTIYQWTQSLGDLDLYIPDVPSGVGARDLAITIERKRLVVALKRREGTTHTYLDHALSHAVKASEAIWTFDSEIREVHISLVKAEPSVVWASVFVGHEQAGNEEADRKQLLLERFQEEHPGFDFRDAEVTGNVPDPKSFLKD